MFALRLSPRHFKKIVYQRFADTDKQTKATIEKGLERLQFLHNKHLIVQVKVISHIKEEASR